MRADVRFAEFANVLHHGKRNIFVIEHPRSAGISRIEFEAGNVEFLDLACGFIQAPRPRRVDDTVAQHALRSSPSVDRIAGLDHVLDRQDVILGLADRRTGEQVP